MPTDIRKWEGEYIGRDLEINPEVSVVAEESMYKVLEFHQGNLERNNGGITGQNIA